MQEFHVKTRHGQHAADFQVLQICNKLARETPAVHKFQLTQQVSEV